MATPLSDRPAMLSDIYPVAFGVAYPALGHCAKGVGLRCGVRRLLNRRHVLNLEAKMINAPRHVRSADQSHPHMAIRKVDGTVGTPVFFLQTEDALVELGEFVTVLHVEGDMADTWLFHRVPPY